MSIVSSSQKFAEALDDLDDLDVWGLINWSSSRSNDATNLQNGVDHAQPKELKLWLNPRILELSQAVKTCENLVVL